MRTCSVDLTCTEDGCRTPNVDPSELTEVEPGREGDFLFPDAGTLPDAGVEDGGPPKPDAGPPDAGPPVRMRTGVVQTAGGASLVSPVHRMTVYVGAPLPMSEQSSGKHTLRLEAE